MKTHLFLSNAKINFGLKVLNKRPDNYHNIKSYFIEISLHDELNFTKSDQFHLSIEGLDLSDDNNLIAKAYNLLKKKL